MRDRKAKKRQTATNLAMAARGSKKKPTDEDMDDIDLSMIGISGASSILEQSGDSD